MIDTRFYEPLGPVAVRDLFPDGEISGDGARLVTGVASFQRAGPDELCFLEDKTAMAGATAGVVVLPATLAGKVAAPAGTTLVLTARPREAYAVAARRLVRERSFQRPGTAISPDAQVESGVTIGPGAVIGPHVQIGEGVELGPNCVIGPGVRIGRRSRIGANVVVSCALIGDEVSVFPGAAIGQPGFGVTAGATGPVDLPHFGRVIIEDRVTLGALVAVDRGMFDDTIISEDAKIDNLTHIGHNVSIGRGVLIAAFGGISGSSTIGDGVVMGGRAGVADHLTIGAGARIGAGAAVLTDVPAGETWTGYPAKPLRRWLRETAWLSRATGKRNAGE